MSSSECSDSDSGEISKTFNNPKSSKILPKMFKNSVTADVYFAFKTDEEGAQAKPIRISAHKNVLSQGSPVFHQMFYGSLRETGTDVQINDVSPGGFDEFLQFFYLNKLTLTNEHVAEVLYLSNKYDIGLECSQMCENFLEEILNEDTFCWGYELAILYDLEKLQNFCTKEIAFGAKRILASESFTNCSREILKRILSKNDLNCTEVDVLDACMKWAERKIVQSDSNQTSVDNLSLSLDRRKEQLGECFDLIRFEVMTPDQLFECLKNHHSTLNINETTFFKNDFHQRLSSSVAAEHCNRNERIWKPPTRPYCEEFHCERITYEAEVENGSYKDFVSQASFTFSTSNRIFLTGLGGPAISSKHFGTSLSVHFEIWTKSAGSWAHIGFDQRVFTCVENVSNYSATCIEFPEAIVINALQNYEIRIKFIDYPRFMYLKVNVKENHNAVTLKDGTEIKFHSNNYNSTNGLISRLCFVSFY